MMVSTAGSLSRPRTPTNGASRPVFSTKGVSPLSPPAFRTPTKTVTATAAAGTALLSPSTTNGATESSPGASKPMTPINSARIVSANRQATGLSEQSQQQSLAVAPKVPLLRLNGGAAAPSPSIDRRQLSVATTAPTESSGLLARKPKPSIGIVKRPESSSIFKKADTPRAPSMNAFSSKHMHSNPFASDRQTDFPNTTKKTSVPRPAEGVTAVQSASHSGRKASAPSTYRATDPIRQINLSARILSKSPSVGRGHGVCAPAVKAPSDAATVWTGERGNAPRSESRFTTGRRCSSAPASTRCQDDEPRRGISVRNTKYGGTLAGVWVPEKKPIKAPSVVRAPYAQGSNTPRAATPPASSRKATSVAPFATNTPRRPVMNSAGSTASTIKRREVSAPYHTMTPRGVRPTSTPVATLRAPFHTTTPRGPRVATKSPVLNSILQ